MVYCYLSFYSLKFAASDEHSRQFLNLPEEALQMVLSQVSDQNLRHTLQFGIGLHHAGLNDKDRSLVEELFANNKIQAHIYYLKNWNWRSYFPCKDIQKCIFFFGMPLADQPYNINAGIGLYQHIGLGCESSSSSSDYQGDVVLVLFSLYNLLAVISFSHRSRRKTKTFFFV